MRVARPADAVNDRVLVVEDEELIARSVAFALRREGFEVETASGGGAALRAAERQSPDLVILDLVLPGGIGGLDVCRQLRDKSSVPIIVLSARQGEMDKLVAFERGADDYVVKPFSLAELIGRVRAQLRRLELDRTDTAPTRRLGELVIDLFRRQVSLAGADLHLTPSEFDLLALLSERPGAAFTRHEIVERLWSSEFVGDSRSCDAHIARLRRKLEHDPRRPTRLVSVRGVGYRLHAAA